MLDDINIQLGAELRKLREARHMTQEDFALDCDISRAYYGRLERGEHSITLELCKKITDAQGLHISDLFVNLP